MKDTITLAELRQTELYRREQTRPLREFLMENIDVLKLADEPVAWFEQDPDMKSIWYQSDQDNSNAIPLYTHPVKYCPSEDNAAYEKGFIDGMAKMTESAVHCAVKGMALKELTDEEIHELANEHLRTQNQDGAKVVLGLEEFARAILRKAQE